MHHDTLSDVLRSVRLKGALYYHVSAGQRWVAEAPAAREIAAVIMPAAEHVMEYHVLIRGQCWAAIVGQPALRLQAGDAIIFPRGDPHVLSSAPGMRAAPAAPLPEPGMPRPFALQLEDGTRRADAEWENVLLCGFLGCDLLPFNPLVQALPPVLRLTPDDGSGGLAQSMHQAVLAAQNRRAGSDALLERMSEALFVDAMCRYVEQLPEGSAGWLAGLRDRFTGRALALMHARPGFAWTVDDLGRQVGLSRSALHERFSGLVGQAPMEYLANWRMQVAAGLMRSTEAPLAAIALEVGYESDAAFSRAFKRLVGTPPAAWRRAQRLSLKQVLTP